MTDRESTRRDVQRGRCLPDADPRNEPASPPSPAAAPEESILPLGKLTEERMAIVLDYAKQRVCDDCFHISLDGPPLRCTKCTVLLNLAAQVRTLQEENEAMRVVLSDARKEAMAVGGALRMGTATRSRLGRLAAKIRLALEPAALSSKTETTP